MFALRTLAAALAATTVAAHSRPLPAHPLAGTWNIEYERGHSNMGGVISATMGMARLELKQRGDSLVGVLTPEDNHDGRGVTPMAIAGVGSGSSATLTSKTTARVNMNGNESTIDVTMTWELTANGDALTGTMSRKSEGLSMPATPSPVKGTRAR
jgi:hypothetical protein